MSHVMNLNPKCTFTHAVTNSSQSKPCLTKTVLYLHYSLPKIMLGWSGFHLRDAKSGPNQLLPS